jgi:STE24 endopeptidase
MAYNGIFWVMIGVLVFGYLLDLLLDILNLRHSLPDLPQELDGIYDEEKYRKSQLYLRENTRFSFLTGGLSLVAVLLLFFLGGFGWLDRWVAGMVESQVLHVLLFFGILGFAADLLGTPFALYGTFVIEEKYGFNRTTPKTFLLDKLKGWLLGAIIGGGLLALITWIFMLTGSWFWLVALGVLTLFSLFMNMFYSNLIVPLFNKQTPLEDGDLRDAITAFSDKAGFKLKNIFVIDGSKRSTKANAYFTGLGAKKRIVLYDTLINDLDIDEIVGVLAHEVGHYKKKHTLTGVILSIVQTGALLFILSLFVGSPVLSEALDASVPSFHIGLIAFGILYSPLSLILGIGMNVMSRKNEYQADRYASEMFRPQPLVEALKKLSRKNLSNLTPHPVYVFFHYSHPPLYQRVKALLGFTSN